MAARVARNLIIVAGVVLLLVQAALVVCWWKLPEWAPQWTYAHSPWPDPVLRSLRYDDFPIENAGLLERLTDLGPAIGPAVLRHYAMGDAAHRRRMLVLTNALTSCPGFMPGDEQPPPPRFTNADLVGLRKEMVELLRMVFTGGSLDLCETASFFVPRVQDRSLVPLMCRVLSGQPTPISPEVANIVSGLGELCDPRAVPTLIPLLPIRHRVHPEVHRALDRCQDHSTFPLVLAALRHRHPVVRWWAAHQLSRYLRPEHGVAATVVGAMRESLAGALLFEAERQEDELSARQAQLQALSEITFHPAAERLRTLAGHSDKRVRVMAIIALSYLGNPQDIPLLSSFLDEPEERVFSEVQSAVYRLQFRASLHQQDEAFRKSNEDEPVQFPTSPASPPIPPVVP